MPSRRLLQQSVDYVLEALADVPQGFQNEKQLLHDTLNLHPPYTVSYVTAWLHIDGSVVSVLHLPRTHKTLP